VYLPTDPMHLSHTRNFPLTDLAGLCYILDQAVAPMSVMELANAGIALDVYTHPPAGPWKLVPSGERLPTRINHGMISLRDLGLVTSQPGGGKTYYELTDHGRSISAATLASYSDRGNVTMNDHLRSAWRPVLVTSAYVRSQWLNHFMGRNDFSYQDLIQTKNRIAISRLPMDERVTSRKGAGDSGYRFASPHSEERRLNDLERREVYEGLRRWTDTVYLTDYRLPPEVEGPFLYQTDAGLDMRFELEWHIVSCWLDPERDVEVFTEQVRQVLRDWGTKSGPIPDLIIYLSRVQGYAKRNIVEMLTSLYYHTNEFFFERGSEFLIRRAFEDVKSEDYYVKIEGSWRTGIMRR